MEDLIIKSKLKNKTCLLIAKKGAESYAGRISEGMYVNNIFITAGAIHNLLCYRDSQDSPELDSNNYIPEINLKFSLSLPNIKYIHNDSWRKDILEAATIYGENEIIKLIESEPIDTIDTIPNTFMDLRFYIGFNYDFDNFAKYGIKFDDMNNIIGDIDGN